MGTAFSMLYARSTRRLLALVCASLLACCAAAPLTLAEHGSNQPAARDDADRVLALVESDPFLAGIIDEVPVARRTVSVNLSPSGANFAVDVYDRDTPVLWIYVQGEPLQIVEVRTGGFDSAVTPPERGEDDLIGGELAGGYLTMSVLTAILLAGCGVIARAGGWAGVRVLIPLLLVATATWSVPLTQHLPGALWIGLFGVATAAAAATVIVGKPDRVSAVPGPVAIGGLAVIGCMGIVGRLAAAIVEPFPTDIGLASATGGAAMVSGRYVYGAADFLALPGGSTYGPLMYMLYAVPVWLMRDYGVAADAASIATTMAIIADVLACVLLVVVCHRLRGRVGAGIALFLWGALPTAWWGVIAGVHDTFVGVCLLAAALAWARPLAAGVMAGLAGALKLAPGLAVVALLGIGGRPGIRRAALLGAGVAIALLPGVIYVAVHGDRGIDLFWSSTVGFQWDRAAPASGWQFVDFAWGRAVAVAGLVVATGLLGRRTKGSIRGATQVVSATTLLLVLLSASWLPNLLLWASPVLVVWTVLMLVPAERSTQAPSMRSTSNAVQSSAR